MADLITGNKQSSHKLDLSLAQLSPSLFKLFFKYRLVHILASLWREKKLSWRSIADQLHSFIFVRNSHVTLTHFTLNHNYSELLYRYILMPTLNGVHFNSHNFSQKGVFYPSESPVICALK